MSVTRQLIKHVRDLAEANPNYVYDQTPCRYLVNKEPSCIIGQAAHKAGVELAELEAWDNSKADSTASCVLPRIGVDGPGLDWLDRVQMAQDRGDPWGEAVAKADKAVWGG